MSCDMLEKLSRSIRSFHDIWIFIKSPDMQYNSLPARKIRNSCHQVTFSHILWLGFPVTSWAVGTSCSSEPQLEGTSNSFIGKPGVKISKFLTNLILANNRIIRQSCMMCRSIRLIAMAGRFGNSQIVSILYSLLYRLCYFISNLAFPPKIHSDIIMPISKKINNLLFVGQIIVS